MQERATKFIEILESEELLSPDILEELRKHVAESKTKLKPELLAKLLVDNGHLTKFQATKLVARMSDSAAEAEAEDPESANDDLTFAEGAGGPIKAEAVEDEVSAVPIVESADDSVEVIQTVESVESVPVIEAGQPSELLGGGASGDSGYTTPTPRPIKKQIPKDNPWDTSRILLRGVGLSILLVALVALVYYFMRGSAEDTLKQAESSYEQRSYETAADQYEKFAATWPTHEKASFAKVRAVLAQIRKEAEGAPDPKHGLDTAMKTLPTIADESGLAGQRDDLTGVLVSLATKFIDRADSREATSERKELMDQLSQLMGLINDPKFVGQAQRTQQSVTLDQIVESEKRINYEIGRDERLALTLGEIDELLKQENTQAAFAKRDELTRTYPFLEADEQLRERILKACEIQRSQVADSSLTPSPSKEAPESAVGNSFVLSNRDGGEARDLRDRTVFVRVKGSVYGLEGETGKLLWRRFVGRGFKSDPLAIGESSSPDALICIPSQGHLLRVEGKTGKVLWFLDFKTQIHMPVHESQDLYVTTHEGDVVSLDLGSGQVIWSKKIPQKLSVGPGLAFGKDNLYLPANHTSLYVLNRKRGECLEVMYLGHKPNSIAVSPVILLGQLFVFENTDTNVGKIRLITMSEEEGLNLKETQVPVPIEGNVIVAPQVDRRRLIVQSDLGHILALDVEVSAESDKVSVMASRAKNVLSPQMSWLVAENNKLWTTDTRLTNMDLQVSMQRFNGNWSKFDGDQFAGPPEKIKDTLIHSRTLRGNRGVRVCAAEANTGNTIWETDLGVPVTLLEQADGKIDAVNSSAMYFELGKERMISTADVNAGKDRVSLNFGSPVFLDSDKAVLFNASVPNQLALFQDGKLRLLTANFGGAKLSCAPIAVGDSVAVALDNGQFVLINPANGAPASSPYQLPMKPGQKVVWNQPLFLADANTIVIAHDQQKLVRLTVGDTLRALTEVDIERPFVGPIVQVGAQIGAIVSAKSGDTLTLFNPTSLKQVAKLALNGRLLSGPFAIDEGCLVHTDAGLQAISPDGKELWSIEFPNSALVGKPGRVNGKLVVSTVAGQVWVLSATDGSVLGNVDAGQAFSSPPIALPQGLLVGSDEGTVLALPEPTTQMISPGGR